MGKSKPGDWWDESWNPITGCTPCSPGCKNCWAKVMVKRFPELHGTMEYDCVNHPFDFEKPMLHPSRLDKPLHWRKPRRVFVCSLGDLFHEDVDYAWLVKLSFAMCETPQHKFFILTKRPWRMLKTGYLWGRENIARGVTVCTQEEADEKIPVLLHHEEGMRFVHVEPILSEISLEPWLQELDWVVCGPENGPGKRPVGSAGKTFDGEDISWIDWIEAQCEVHDVPFWDKRANGIHQRPEGW